jgi:hypothetical protein
MPGLGKTQVALKYAELASKEKRYPYIFWISAASIDKLIQGFSKLLDLVAFAGRATLGRVGTLRLSEFSSVGDIRSSSIQTQAPFGA